MGTAKAKAAPRRVRAISREMRLVRAQEATLKAEFLALPENRYCPVMAVIFHKPRVRTEDHHHTRGKAFPALRLAVKYWLAVSRFGHDWIERNKEQARQHGWLCAKGKWNTL